MASWRTSLNMFLEREERKVEQRMKVQIGRWAAAGNSCREENGFSVIACTLWCPPFLGSPLGRKTTVPTVAFHHPHLSSGSRGRSGQH